jgi:hypothetical protein
MVHRLTTASSRSTTSSVSASKSGFHLLSITSLKPKLYLPEGVDQNFDRNVQQEGISETFSRQVVEQIKEQPRRSNASWMSARS